MKKVLAFAIVIMIMFACKESETSYAKEKKEVQDFLNNYKVLLRDAKFDSVALLYVDSGFVSNGQGEMATQNKDSIKAFYARFPKVKNDFMWKNTRIDILDKNVALVNSLFLWHDKGSSDTIKNSYTGVYIKKNNVWKIKSEHESIDTETFVKLIKESEKKEKNKKQ